MTFLSRLPSTRFDDLDFTHPILAGSTMAELREAMDEIARKSNDDLSETYSHWMGSSDTLAIGPDMATDWMPLTKLRYTRLQHRSILTSRAAIVWSPADIWLVHYFPLNLTGWRKLFYAFQSAISKEPAQYFTFREPLRARRGDILAHHRVVVPPTERRLPVRRPLMGALNEMLGTSMEGYEGASILATDPDHPLHNYITQTFRS